MVSYQGFKMNGSIRNVTWEFIHKEDNVFSLTVRNMVTKYSLTDKYILLNEEFDWRDEHKINMILDRMIKQVERIIH